MKKILIPLFLVLILIPASCSTDDVMDNDKTPEEVPVETSEESIEAPEADIAEEETPDRTFNPAADNFSVKAPPLDTDQLDRLDTILSNRMSGGPPPDGIPPIEVPDYYSIEDADDILNNPDRVFVLELKEQVLIYPQNILVWHEIVNLRDSDLALTYCPLTGSAITYKYPEDVDTTFGTSGSLINSNLLMYDRATDTYISQIHGTGLDKDLKGYQLETVPTFWTTWEQAKEAYPDALVLSIETGHMRNYTNDPYGSYTQDYPGNYYQEERLFFPALNDDEDNTFEKKYPITGVKFNNEFAAVDPALVKEENVVLFTLDDQEFLAVYDQTISAVRVFINDRELSFDPEDMMFTDGDGMTYTIQGIAEDGGRLLSPTYFDVMWFAWFGFYPDTLVLK